MNGRRRRARRRSDLFDVNQYEMTSYHTYAASTTTQVTLPESGYITEIGCLLEATVTAGSSVTAGEDPLARLISSSRIRASGARFYFDVSDGRQWYWWAYCNREGQIQVDSLPSASASSTIRLWLPIHWGVDWTNPYDTSVVLPARELEDVTMEVTWGTASSLGTGYTISSATLKLFIREVILKEGRSAADAWPMGIPSPRMEPKTETQTSTSASLSLEHDAPVGDMLYQTLVMVETSANARTDAEVTEFGIKFPKRRSTPFDWDWQALKAVTRADNFLPTTNTGIAFVRWEYLPGAGEYGLDLSNAQQGDVKTAFTTEVGSGTVHELHYAIGRAFT